MSKEFEEILDFLHSRGFSISMGREKYVNLRGDEVSISKLTASKTSMFLTIRRLGDNLFSLHILAPQQSLHTNSLEDLEYLLDIEVENGRTRIFARGQPGDIYNVLRIVLG